MSDLPTWWKIAFGLAVYIAALATIGHIGHAALKWWLRKKGWIE